jgi:replicative DNA helicase
MDIVDTLAEKALIGSCLIDSSVYFRANIIAADFYDEQHRNIWIAIGAVLREGNCDYVTLVNYIKGHRLGIQPSYLTELITMSPSALNAESYADIVLDRSNRRKALQAASDMANAAADNSRPFDPAPFVETALRTSRFTGRRTNEENLSAYMDWYIGKISNPGKLSGISTGIDGLDLITDGIERGTTFLLSGKPKLGKSTIAAQIGLTCARNKYNVVIYSLEISDLMILNRWVSIISEVPAFKIKRGEVNAEEQEKISAAMAQINQLPIHIVFNDQLTTSNIMSDLMRRTATGNAADLIVVDYSGRLKDPLEKGEEELDRQAKCISRIRSISARMNCATILVHTLNKEGDIAGRVGAQYDVDVIAALYQTKNAPDTPDGRRCITIDILAQRDQNSVGVGSEVRLTRKRDFPYFEEVI